jgi:hypothetical protein
MNKYFINLCSFFKNCFILCFFAGLGGWMYGILIGFLIGFIIAIIPSLFINYFIKKPNKYSYYKIALYFLFPCILTFSYFLFLEYRKVNVVIASIFVLSSSVMYAINFYNCYQKIISLENALNVFLKFSILCFLISFFGFPYLFSPPKMNITVLLLPVNMIIFSIFFLYKIAKKEIKKEK